MNPGAPLITIIMPTYNSEETIGRALKSLMEQTVPYECIEVLVIDGGSTDNTLAIAGEFRVTMLENPDRLPEKAKHIGFSQACGEYIIKMDSDEILTHTDQLERRLAFFKRHPEVHCLIANRLISPKKGGPNTFARNYINTFGDPFTLFVYQTKSTILETFCHNVLATESKGETVLRFAQGDVLPIADGGTTMFSMAYVRQALGDRLREPSFVVSVAQEIIQRDGVCGCIRGDEVLHLTKASFKMYVKKLRFRVINNLLQAQDSGFTNRAASTPALRHRKFLFPLYAASIVLPLVHSVCIAIKERDSTLLAHFVYVYLVCVFILYYGIKKLFGGKISIDQYG